MVIPRTATSALVVLLLLASALVSLTTTANAASTPRTRYQVYFESGLCPVDIAEQVDCPPSLPICCVANNGVRCCAANTPCDNCTSDAVGYQMARGSVLIGVMSLVMVLLIGSMVASGLGRHLAWSIERSRVIRAYREKMQLRRTAARRFKEELAATEERDLPDEVACTICCARRMDCALAPCGHVCCCHFCAKRMKECPVCRVAVEQCYDLPAYLVARLSGQVRDDAEMSQEMVELSGAGAGFGAVEDERETPGLLSTAHETVDHSGDDEDGGKASTKKAKSAAASSNVPTRKKGKSKNKYQRANSDEEDQDGRA